ncbi:grasp-with-spasm system SPASM domain peptide maturase [Flavobacterium sp.]|uniref:grasp-with-spasm system SPASM domain peptide maturase n=1 Tax=Flavobacterium sp. TaxID=239 RepID=UPI0028BDD207|nr:grasp-with-spasm system SPASM domain peptide maturase [Flavobacterium sp.]
MKKSNFVLFADCIPVKGTNRSIISDTKNNTYFFIPNALYDILEKCNGKTIEDIKKEFNYEYDEIIDDYFDFLISNRLGFFSLNPNLFPKISTEWSSPCSITNSIIDFDEVNHDFENLIHQLENLKCSYIQLRFYKKIELNYIKRIVRFLERIKSRIVYIDFIVPFYENFILDELNAFISENNRVHSIIIYDAPFDKSYSPINSDMGYVVLVERNVLNEKSCGVINSEYFYSNIKLFSESQYHNTCLNKKISIDKEGYIRNCPSMPQHFGNIKDTTLKQALSQPDFKKYWNVTKDMIEVCKDCEFRHICTDCRAYTEQTYFDGEIDLSKPLKCGYNPYTNEWSEWSANPLKKNAIEYYSMQELVK